MPKGETTATTEGKSLGEGCLWIVLAALVLLVLGYSQVTRDSDPSASTLSGCTVASSKSPAITVSPYLPTNSKQGGKVDTYEYDTVFYIDGPGELTVDEPPYNVDVTILRFDILPADSQRCELRVYVLTTKGKTISIPVRTHGLGADKNFTWKEVNGQPATLS